MCLSFTADSLIEDPTLSYMPEQLRHLVVAQTVLANLPPEGVERRAWAQWRWNEVQFHIDAIHLLKLAAREQVSTSLLPTSVELPAPPIIVDIAQPVSALMLEGQPLTQMVTISNAMPFHMLFSRDTEVILMSQYVFLTLLISILELAPAPSAWGANGNVMGSLRSIVLPVALRVDDDFQTF
jgi:hypothetical protein